MERWIYIASTEMYIQPVASASLSNFEPATRGTKRAHAHSTEAIRWSDWSHSNVFETVRGKREYYNFSTEDMPSSRRRKKQVVASRRQLEKTRRKLNQKAFLDQENQASDARDGEGLDTGGKEDGTSTKTWWDWCTSGVTQVRLITDNGYTCTCTSHS